MNETDLLELYATIRKDKPYHKEIKKGNVVEIIDAKYTPKGISIIIKTKKINPSE